MSKLRINLIVNLLARVWTGVLAIAFVPVYSRLLGIEGYGLIGFFTSFQSVLFVLDLGLSTTLNRELARMSTDPETAPDMRDLVRTMERVYWSAAVLIGVLMVSVSPFLSTHWLHPKHLSPHVIAASIGMMGLAIAFQFPMSLYQGGLLGLQRQVQVNGIVIGGATLRAFGATAILTYVSRTPTAYFAWQLVVSALQTFAAVFCLWQALGTIKSVPRFRVEMLANIWRFAAGIAGIGITVTILMQLDKLVVSKMLPLSTMGYYSMAGVISSTMIVITTAIFAAVFPRYSQLVALNDEANLRKLYHRTCQVMAVALFPAAMTAIVHSHDLMVAWNGRPAVVEHTYRLVSVLTLGAMLNGLNTLPYAIQLAYGWTKLTLTTNVIISVIQIPLLIFVTHRYGAIGAGSTWILVNSAYVLVTQQIMHRRYLIGELGHWYRDDVALPLIAVAVVTIAARLLLHNAHSRLIAALTLVVVWLLSVAAAAIAAPQVREILMRRLRPAVA